MNFKEIFTKLTFPTDWRCTGASYVLAPNDSENVIWLFFFSSEPTWLPVLKKSCQLLKGSTHQRSKSASIIPPVYKGTQASYFVLRWREFRYELIATEITEVSIGTYPSARGVLFWVWIRRTFSLKEISAHDSEWHGDCMEKEKRRNFKIVFSEAQSKLGIDHWIIWRGDKVGCLNRKSYANFDTLPFFPSVRDSWNKERSEKDELLKNTKAQNLQQQARAQDAEVIFFRFL